MVQWEGLALALVVIAGYIAVWYFKRDRDEDRIVAEIAKQGGEVLRLEWKPFAPGILGAMGDRNERHYVVRYRDRAGNEYQGLCKTSSWTGVYWREHECVQESEEGRRHRRSNRAQPSKLEQVRPALATRQPSHELLAHRGDLWEQVRGLVVRADATDSGYTLYFEPGPLLLEMIAEILRIESELLPFISFELRVAPGQRTSLRLEGPAGTRELVERELGFKGTGTFEKVPVPLSHG